jgi:hypothetical protein
VNGLVLEAILKGVSVVFGKPAQIGEGRNAVEEHLPPFRDEFGAVEAALLAERIHRGHV